MAQYLYIWVGAYWFSATSLSKWPPGGHIGFFGFRTNFTLALNQLQTSVAKYLCIWVRAYWFSVTSFSKWLPGGHIRFFVFWMAWFRQRNSHGGPSEAGDCSHPPPKMATPKNASSCKATFDHVIGIGSLRFLACEEVLDIANPWYSNERSSRDSLASRGTRTFQREAGDSMAPDRRRRVTHGWEAGDSYFRFNFCELLFRCHTQY